MSNQFYSNLLCHKEGEEDESIKMITEEPLEETDKASAEISNDDIEEVQPQRVNQELVQTQPAKSEIEISNGSNEESNAKSTPHRSWTVTELANPTEHLRKEPQQENEDDSDDDVHNEDVNQMSPTKIPLDGNSADLPSPNKFSQTKPTLNWADEVDEETPLTHYEPLVFLTPPPVNKSDSDEVSQVTWSKKGRHRANEDTRSYPRGQTKTSVTAGAHREQQVSQDKLDYTMKQDRGFLATSSRKTSLKNQKRRARNKLAARMKNQAEAGHFLRRTLSSSSDEDFSQRDQPRFLDIENKRSIQSAEDYCRVFGYLSAADRLKKRPFPGDTKDKGLVGLMEQLSSEEYYRDAARERCSRPGCKKAKKCFEARRSRSYAFQPNELYSLLECHEPIKKSKLKKTAQNNLTANDLRNSILNPKLKKKCTIF